MYSASAGHVASAIEAPASSVQIAVGTRVGTILRIFLVGSQQSNWVNG